VKSFFFSHYAPNNAVLVIAGNIEPDNAKILVEKWFGDVPRREIKPRQLPAEPTQTEAREMYLERPVPQDAFYRAYPMVERLHPDYYACDLISDILSNGRSSWFHETLIKQQQLFSEVDAFIMGSVDPGLFIISGKPLPGKTYKECEMAIDNLLNQIAKGEFSERELEKVKNRCIAARKLEWASSLNKAIDLAYFELLGDAAMINEEEDKYINVTHENVMKVAADIFQKNKCSTIYYKKQF